MTREQLQQLKVIDDQIIRAAFGLQNLIRDRAAIDEKGTTKFVSGINKTFTQCVKPPKK